MHLACSHAAVFKSAYITRRLKKASLDPADVKSYRPFSDWAVLSKTTLERHVSHQLAEHLILWSLLSDLGPVEHVILWSLLSDLGRVEHLSLWRLLSDLGPVEHVILWSLLSDAQSACRANHSTQTAVLRVMSDILDTLDRGDFAVLTLLDLSAAFDTVDHVTLLRRLKTTYGITGTALVWFTAYLHDRKLPVRYRGSSSTSSSLLCGVEFHKGRFSDRSCSFCTR